ncbi:retrovirus-related pol polyprotein from transposon TNT 1-94 [Tanacetum coccineum]|uniref:Retrovirus-related pol polyprotein from transposon TNT 1-94 n=1 Tax=Tanacetum coccineum TaxID=301880 RepID=A0ABQ4YA98_9ASTR
MYLSSSQNPNDDTIDVLILMQEPLGIFRTLMMSLQDKDGSSVVEPEMLQTMNMSLMEAKEIVSPTKLWCSMRQSSTSRRLKCKFSSVSPKQVYEEGSELGQNPLNDDYSWLDGYQLQASMMADKTQQSSLKAISKKTGMKVQFGVDESKMMERLWGDNHFDTNTRKLTTKNTKSADCKRGLSHLNFDTINLLPKKDNVNSLPKLKYVKDQLCSSCKMGKEKRSTFKTKIVPSSKGRLHLLHMGLCGPMRIESINEKKYILIIVDDYSRYTWTHFLRSKDETQETLHAYFKEEGIEHQTSIARTPEQNDTVKRQNRTLIEAARTMLSTSKLPLFFWAKAIEIACYTQNRSLIIPRHKKTPYHIINDRKPTLKHLHIFGCRCYITRDGENLDKMKEKGDPYLGIQDHSNETSSSKLVPNVFPLADIAEPSIQELDLLFSPMYKEYFTTGNQRVSKFFALSNNLQQQDTQPTLNVQPTTEPITPPTNVNAKENNIDQAAADAQFEPYEFINPFSTPVQEVTESSSRNVDTSNMHTFYQRHRSGYH